MTAREQYELALAISEEFAKNYEKMIADHGLPMNTGGNPYKYVDEAIYNMLEDIQLDLDEQGE